MGNQRRRGKSVVFDSLPSLVTAEDDNFGISRNASRFSDKMSREALREIIMVLVGLALVVWLFFGQNGGSELDSQLRMGSRQILQSDSAFIVPAHMGLGGSNAREGVKKAPGDKQGLKSLETTSTKKSSGAIYQYDGPDSPKLVLVTVIDDNRHPRDYVDKIVENRIEYAQRHHFGVLVKYVSDFQKFVADSYNHQSTWARVALSMEAQISFPQAEWFWYLGDDAIIMQPEVNVLASLVESKDLESKLIREVPVMRYSNTHIRTFQTNSIGEVNYIFPRDGRGISSDSFFFKNSVPSRIWLQVWGEPLYRSFQRFADEQEALGHLMQWHSQFLVRTGVVDSRYIASQAILDGIEESIRDELAYQAGDLVAIVACDYSAEACKHAFQKKWNERERALTVNPTSGVKQGAAKDTVQNQVQVQAQEKAQEKAEKKVAADAEAEAQQAQKAQAQRKAAAAN